MKHLHVWLVVLTVVLVGSFNVRLLAADQLRINEFMAVNTYGLDDDSGDEEDWIEIFNYGTTTVNLDGWFLTDKTNNLTKWRFPATNLPPNNYLIVFASERDRKIPGRELHTNFKLAQEGEYLALVKPDGLTVASDFYPNYPIQAPDISYGWGRASSELNLVPLGAPARALVPPNNSLEPPSGSPPETIRPWTAESLDDASWTVGTTGVGYEAGTGYEGLLGLSMPWMQNSNQTIYIRIAFNVNDPSILETLTLWMEYDDGFIAYLNGHLIASDAAPTPVTSATWDSASPVNRDEGLAVTPQAFNATAYLSFLKVGINVLAIQGLNNGLASSDLLIRPRLTATTRDTGLMELRYFPDPTPGVANNLGVAVLGPIITDDTFSPKAPSAADPITVTARLQPAFGPVTMARLRYRVMYGSEVELPFVDDGLHGDGAAGDGLFGGIIPGGIATNGQMIRWFVAAQDASGNASRSPAFADPLNSPEYSGTVIPDPTLTNPLPVLHTFMQNPGAADNATGTRCSLYFLGEFYDNLNINLHGQSSTGFPKKSYDIDFHPGYNFRWKEGEAKVDDINLLTTYPDKAHMRNALSYGVYRDAGNPYHYVQSVRVQRNSVFYGEYDIVENGDDNFLERNSLDPHGALYKMYATFTAATDATGGATAEKKTRQNEDHSDLLALFNGVSTQTGAARVRYILDNVDVPEMINFLAARIITSDVDCCHKNYYFYRDTEGNGEWQAFAWDVDLSFGRNWNSTLTYWDQILHPNNGLNVGNNNNMFIPLLNTTDTPMFRQMYLRRLRTLMDELVQPPSTPAAEGKWEKRMDEILAQVRPDAELDAVAWPQSDTWGNGSATATTFRQSVTEAVTELKTSYVPARRAYMYNSLTEIPAAQPTNANLLISTVEYNPTSGNQAQEYLVLTNFNNFALDISGWQVTGGISHTFKGGTIIPPLSALYLAQDVKAFRARTTSPRGGQGLFIRGNYSGQLSARGETVTVVDKNGREVHSYTYPGTPSLPQQYLRITEIMYHPATLAGNTNDAEAFEFVELKNVGAVPLDLAGVRLTNGIDFNFTTGAVTSLAPGETVLVVADPAAFTARYGPGFSIAGRYVGFLDNSGERLRLIDATGEEILDFSYNNSWYPMTDGLGFSLVVVDPLAEPDLWGTKSQWRQSGLVQGTPGAPDLVFPVIAPILINEVLTHTDPPQVDAIELYNPNASNVTVGGWFLSDDFNTPRKFRIPNGTIIPAGGFIAYNETNFNPVPGTPPSFAFSSDGDEAYLFSGDATTNLTGYYHGYTFGASANGVSFGRHVTSDAVEHFVAQAGMTFSNANAGPLVGPVVITEIMYHPVDFLVSGVVTNNPLDEYIELFNSSGSAVALYDTNHPTNRWRLRDAVDFDFPAGTTLPAGGYALVVSFSPTNTAVRDAFRARNGVSPAVPLYGPWDGQLDNTSDSVELERPDNPNPSGNVPYILVEQVKYTDQVPWPAAADGFGPSMHRFDVALFGNEPTNWIAAVPTPGAAFAGGDLPVITSQPADVTIREFETATFSVGVSGAGPFSYQWRSNSLNIPGATGSSYVIPNVQSSYAASYSVMVTSAGLVVSRNALLTVRRLPQILVQPRNVSTNAGSNAIFTVAVAGTGAISYQWQRYGQNVEGATASALTITNAQYDVNDGFYTVQATDDVGTVVSQPAYLSVRKSPTITQQLQILPSTNVLEGRSFTLTMGASGSLPLYFVFRSPRDLGYAVQVYYTNSYFATLVVDNAKSNLHTGQWSVSVSNGVTPAVLSTRFTVTVIPALPFFALHPTNQTVASGTNVLLASEARGTGPILYQWYFNGTNALPAGTNATLMLSNVSATAVGEYHVTAANSLGAATSAVAQVTLRVGPVGPQIVTQPANQVSTVCGTAQFTVEATSTLPLGYQWFFNTTNLLALATNATLSLHHPHPADVGGYQAVVSDSSASVTSTVATLTLTLGDCDGDGIPDAWELAHGLDPTSPADRDLDPDNDGRTNWQEAQSGTDPHDPASVLKVRVTNGGSNVVLEFAAMPGVSYSVQHTSPIGSGTWQSLTNIPPLTGTNWLQISDPAGLGNSSRFYRLVTPMVP